MTKPDFIIIGAMKSATSTLHMQLALQPGIFMSNPKEPNYFSDDTEHARGEQWYESLFSEARPTDICGESSTHYTKMPHYPLTIERMARRLKSPKLIYVMRHPIDRLISHYIHQWSQNAIKCDINEAIDRYEELIAYSCYAQQLTPYIEQFGLNSILPVFAEIIRQEPQQQIQRVADFIGYRGQVIWQDEVSFQNVSRERIRHFRGYDSLIESKFMASFRKLFIPRKVRDMVKNKFIMKDAPEIDKVRFQYVKGIFDKDLKKLGTLLGMDLNCQNYKDRIYAVQHDSYLKGWREGKIDL